MNLSTSSFSVFFIKLLLLISIVSIILNKLFENQIILKTEISGAFKVHKIVHKNLNCEIPIFGSSRAKTNFCSSLINKNIFNYGIDGIGSKVWLFFLEKELEKEKNKPILINFDLDGFRNYVGDKSNYLLDYPTLKLFVNNHFIYRISLIRNFGFYQSYLTDFLKYKLSFKNVIDKGGVHSNQEFDLQNFNFNLNKRTLENDYFQTDSIQLRNFYSLIKSTSRPIYLVISPYHDSAINNFSNLNKADIFLENIDQLDNLMVLDFRDIDLKKEMFYNTTHLNYNGAKQFSQLLSDTLKSIDPENFN
ncbi:MAG: hypothetical protein P8H35_08145 [Flavobacteriales bacterium]|nr:hypothetical protein [Flavobacteriales bacterium]